MVEECPASSKNRYSLYIQEKDVKMRGSPNGRKIKKRIETTHKDQAGMRLRGGAGVILPGRDF